MQKQEVLSCSMEYYSAFQPYYVGEISGFSKLFLLKSLAPIELRVMKAKNNFVLDKSCEIDDIILRQDYKVILPLKNLSSLIVTEKEFQLDEKKFKKFKNFIGARRCRGIDKEPKLGQRCGRYVKNISGLCHDHEKQ